jgi:hypothetical protein
VRGQGLADLLRTQYSRPVAVLASLVPLLANLALLAAPGSAFRLARSSTDTNDLCFPTFPILSHFHPSLCQQRHDAFV